MTLRIANDWQAPVSIGWPLPGAPRFARSRAYDIFLRELRRYVVEEVPGRSFLIAGHRGAGKTTLVAEAERALSTDLLQQSIALDAATSRRGRLQRPLLVKLVGPSLTAPPPGAPPAPPAPPAEDGGAAAAPAAPNASDAAASAITHITIALYRALAQEVAKGFAVHAAHAAVTRRAEMLELSNQLVLDLDNAPAPALLRDRWARLGRLAPGILWPPDADDTLAITQVTDQALVADQALPLATQGLREIVATATAAQVFQRCLGTLTETETAGETAARSSSLTASADIKDMIARAGAALTGAVAGGATAIAGQGTVPAIGLGLLVWLASGAALSWSGTRSRGSSQALNTTFVRDRSLQTLQRDLPLVIARIRAAGLAPVFVIDELDKLPDAGAATIADILDRLKHLIADYGCFCFLTDRKYFDEIERDAANGPYPKEHTYFSERLLVLHAPDELFDYLTLITTTDPAPPSDAERLPIATFALATICRARMNFTDIGREISRATDADGVLRHSADDLRTRAVTRIEATIQLSIEELLRDERFAARFRDSARFAQIATDAFYYIAREWAKPGVDAIDLSDKQIDAYIVERSPGLAPQRNDAPSQRASGTDLILARELVRRQAEILANFPAFADAIGQRPELDPWRRSEIVPTELPAKGLVARLPGGGVHYRFLIDETGTPIENVATGAALGATSEAQLALIKAFADLLGSLGLTIELLVAARLLPATLSTGLIDDAAAVLRADPKTVEADTLTRAVTTARQLETALGENSVTLGSWLALLGAVLEETDPERRAVAAAEALAAIGRYLSPTSAASRNQLADASKIAVALLPASDQKAVLVTLRLDRVAGIAQLRLLIGMARKNAISASAPDDDALWALWRDRLLAWFHTPPAARPDISLVDVLAAAKRRLPNILFRADLSQMTIPEWSSAVLASLAVGPDQAPAWVFAAGMRALGFDHAQIAAALTELAPSLRDGISPYDRLTIGRILNDTKAPTGALALAHELSATISWSDVAKGGPILVVAAEAYPQYKAALDVLGHAGLVSGVINVVG